MADDTPPSRTLPRQSRAVSSRAFAGTSMGRELGSIGFALVALFLVIALSTAVGGDNATGVLGLRAAQGLQFLFGQILAYAVPLCLLGAAVILWRGTRVSRLPERILGGWILAISVCGLIAMPYSGSDVTASTGFRYGGALGHALVHSRTLNLLGALGSAGCILILVSTALVGCLMVAWRSPRTALADLGRLMEWVGQAVGMIRPVGVPVAPPVPTERPRRPEPAAPKVKDAGIWGTESGAPAPRLGRMVMTTPAPAAITPPTAPKSQDRPEPARSVENGPGGMRAVRESGLFPRFSSDSQLVQNPSAVPPASAPSRPAASESRTAERGSAVPSWPLVSEAAAPVPPAGRPGSEPVLRYGSAPAQPAAPLALWADEDEDDQQPGQNSNPDESVSPARRDWSGFPKRRPSSDKPREGDSFLWVSGAPSGAQGGSSKSAPWADEVAERVGSAPVPPTLQVPSGTSDKPPIDSDFAPDNTINPSKPARVSSRPWSRVAVPESPVGQRPSALVVDDANEESVEAWLPEPPSQEQDSMEEALSDRNRERETRTGENWAHETDPWMGWGRKDRTSSPNDERDPEENRAPMEDEDVGHRARHLRSPWDGAPLRTVADSDEVANETGQETRDRGEYQELPIAYREALEAIPGIWPGNRSQADFLMDPEYALPGLNLFDAPPSCHARLPQEVLLELADRLQSCLGNHNIDATVENAVQGPAVIRFDLKLAQAQRVAPIARLDREIAIAMRCDRVRILGPGGAGTIGVEIPSPSREMVYLADLLRAHVFRTHPAPLAIPLGKGMSGEPVLCDLATTPHLLIAGSTGQGKSVCLNTILISLLMRRTPDELRLLLIDPKQVELNFFRAIPHLLAPIITEPRKAAAALLWVCELMEHRYELCKQLNARNIDSYNGIARGGANHPKSGGRELEVMPHIIVVIDELADLMLQVRREIEDPFSRLAAKARACGIHLIIATQRPSVDVITGTIKNNFPSRIAFLTKTEADSRTVLGQSGAETLLGKGDMIYDLAGAPALQRVQGCFVSEADVERVADYLRAQAPVRYVKHDFPVAGDENSSRNGKVRTLGPDEYPGSGSSGDDELERTYEKALRLVLEARKASVSMVQRKLQIGFPKAGRLMDMMEERGIVGAADSSKVREILVDPDEFLRRLDELGDGIYYDED